eukprot:1419691-Pyramimonas_sp.AAC.1
MAPAAAAPTRDEADENWTMATGRRNRSKASDCAPPPCKQRVAGDMHDIQAPGASSRRPRFQLGRPVDPKFAGVRADEGLRTSQADEHDDE